MSATLKDIKNLARSYHKGVKTSSKNFAGAYGGGIKTLTKKLSTSRKTASKVRKTRKIRGKGLLNF